VPRHRRRFALALVLSILAHAAFFYFTPGRKPPELVLAGSRPDQPMTVQIVQAETAAPEAKPSEQVEPPRPAPPPRPVPVPPLPTPRIVRRSTESVPAPEPRPPEPQPPPRPPIPEFDMAAMIEARRAQRRAQEAMGASRPNLPPTPDQLAQANISRNLMMDQGGGVGGVFQILRKGTRTAEFAFNGWRPDTEKRWREVIEVDAGPGGDVERAIVRRMIALIRTHYTGDFRWESQHLGRVVVLSARQEDNEGLEDFLIREFFGTPVLKEPG
jgi:outer membrane biosynthesis protein TonB